MFLNISATALSSSFSGLVKDTGLKVFVGFYASMCQKQMAFWPFVYIFYKNKDFFTLQANVLPVIVNVQ